MAAIRIEQLFTIDVISLVPDNSSLFIQAPSIGGSQILEMWQQSQFPYYKEILLSKTNKGLFINIIEKEGIESYFQSVEIRFNNQLLFEAYDGLEYGEISKTIILPHKFTEDYIEGGLCIISQDW
jgi:hypothetical protein